MAGPSVNPAVRVRQLYKSFGLLSLLAGVSFDVATGDAIGIIGGSGAGKTTLLKCINMLTPIDRGYVSLGDEVIQNIDPDKGLRVVTSSPSGVRRRVGLVFQEWNLWPNMNIRQNIAEGPITVSRMNKRRAYALAEQLAHKVSIADKLDFYPNQLSGGQRQRAAIARALAMEPEVLMLDEITSALDPSLVSEILDLVLGLRASARALIVVTHHLEFARQLCSSILFLCDGRILEEGAPRDILDNPQTPELTKFLRRLERAK